MSVSKAKRRMKAERIAYSNKYNDMSVKARQQTQVEGSSLRRNVSVTSTNIVSEAPAARAPRLKGKADWVKKSRQRAEAKRNCRFFALPAEIRELIYSFVFAPGPIIELRKQRSYLKRNEKVTRADRSRPLVRCEQMIGKRNGNGAHQVRWATSVSGLLLVDKHTYNEAVSYLYESCTFVFEPMDLAYAFLRTVRKIDLRNIRNIQVDHEFHSYGKTEDSEQARDKADHSFAKLCHQLALHLPNVTSLEVRIALKDQVLLVIPDLNTPEFTYDIEELSTMPFINCLRNFTKLKKLDSIKVKLQMPTETWIANHFIRWYRPTILEVWGLTPLDEQSIAQNWNMWCRYFHKSLASAIERIIGGCEEKEAWDGHLKMLDGYQKWRADPRASWTVYYPGYNSIQA